MFWFALKHFQKPKIQKTLSPKAIQQNIQHSRNNELKFYPEVYKKTFEKKVFETKRIIEKLMYPRVYYTYIF